jgi:RNA polymerase sigma-70 factor (ECF subfamily)
VALFRIESMAREDLGGRDRFPTTSWGIVAAVGSSATAESRPALEALCRAYWYPLYAFLRRTGRAHEDAQDLVQGFFVQLLERGDLGRVTPEGGRFRSYLLTALKHFVVNVRKHEQARKRGGGRTIMTLDLDFAGARRRYSVEPATKLDPERLYEQRWALTLLANVLSDLTAGFAGARAKKRYEVLEGFLPGARHEMTYKSAAEILGTTQGAVKVAVHRLRARYRRRFRDAVADTVERPEDVDDEVRHILGVLAG